MATLPTPGGDVGTWGPELNEYVSETRDVADDALTLAYAAQALAQQAASTPDLVLSQAQTALDAALAASSAAIAAAAAAAEAAALAQSIVADIVPVSLPPGGTDGQIVTKDSGVPIIGASWQNPTGQVLSVNGDIGNVVLNAADVGALADDYTPPVESINGETGIVSLSAADVGAVATGSLSGLVSANTDVAANTAARHTHANSAILAATEESYTTAQHDKLAGVATAATANSTDGTLLARANHTGTQAESTVTGLVTDLALLAPKASPTFTGTVTVPDNSFATTKVSGFTEAVQDIAGAAIIDGTGIDVTYNDGAGTITITGGVSVDVENVLANGSSDGKPFLAVGAFAPFSNDYVPSADIALFKDIVIVTDFSDDPPPGTPDGTIVLSRNPSA